MWKIFQKKKEEKPKKQKTDFSQYKVELNIKTMCAYEHMTGKPFVKVETDEDVKKLFYCSLVVNNHDLETMTYDVFMVLIEEEEIVNWLVEKYMKLSACISQYSETLTPSEGESGVTEDKEFFISEAAAGLIVRMGLDPHYVMYEMDQWEMVSYYDMMRDMERERLTEERLWTYLQVLPHVGKSLSSPEKMLPFPWDKNSAQEVKKKLEQNSAAAFAFLSKQTKTNGEG